MRRGVAEKSFGSTECTISLVGKYRKMLIFINYYINNSLLRGDGMKTRRSRIPPDGLWTALA
jgi:hypothetical protein